MRCVLICYERAERAVAVGSSDEEMHSILCCQTDAQSEQPQMGVAMAAGSGGAAAPLVARVRFNYTINYKYILLIYVECFRE